MASNLHTFQPIHLQCRTEIDQISTTGTTPPDLLQTDTREINATRTGTGIRIVPKDLRGPKGHTTGILLNHTTETRAMGDNIGLKLLSMQANLEIEVLRDRRVRRGELGLGTTGRRGVIEKRMMGMNGNPLLRAEKIPQRGILADTAEEDMDVGASTAAEEGEAGLMQVEEGLEVVEEEGMEVHKEGLRGKGRDLWIVEL